MNVVALVALLVYTFGLFAYGSMVVYEVRQFLGRRDGELQACETGPGSVSDLLLTCVCFAWFAVNILLALGPLNPDFERWPVIAVFILVVYAFPPLIMKVVLVEARERARHPAWRAAVWVVGLASAGFAVTGILLLLDVIENAPRFLHNLGFSINGLFAVAGVYSAALLLTARRRDDSSSERSFRAALIFLFATIVVLSGAVVLANAGYFELGDFFDKVVLRSLPLAFLSVGAWFENRFRFFDLFVKRGISLALTIVLLTAYFGVVISRLEGVDLGWSRPWVYAVTLLPLVLALPWIYQGLGRLLDSVWLGRRFTPGQAVRHFLAALGRATSEDELVAEAERGLSAIFQAPTRIDLELREVSPDGFRQVVEVPVRSDGERTGAIRLGRRANQAPFFSQDLVLLGSLAEVFATLLDNVRLQRKKQEQEDRARELSLHASRSELKALRAQIDPHFLFNALNAIAGLIHKDPLRADRAVEQLAEVFRYTLRRSESEWATVQDELELARAYLEIQQARFGSRLRFDVDCDPGVRACRVPTMMIQTLVENAVKHGIGPCRDPGAIEIRAGRSDGRLRVEVADSGPGFPDGDAEGEPAGPARETGYGLRNVRLRLRGHFGEDAALHIARDAARERTVVALVLPLAGLEAPPTRTAGSAGGARP